MPMLCGNLTGARHCPTGRLLTPKFWSLNILHKQVLGDYNSIRLQQQHTTKAQRPITAERAAETKNGLCPFIHSFIRLVFAFDSYRFFVLCDMVVHFSFSTRLTVNVSLLSFSKYNNLLQTKVSFSADPSPGYVQCVNVQQIKN